MRYIPITVSDEYVLGDNVAAGAAGSHNDVALVITFGEMWEGTAKTIVWHDANGENPTLTLITDTMKDENGAYVVPIPAEPKAVEGEMLMTIKGVVTDTTDTSKEKSATMTATARFFVLGSAWDAAAESSADVNATAAAQLQTAIDAETAARTAAVSAEEEAREAAIANVNTAIEAQETSLKSYVDSSVANAVTKKDITAEVKNALESADMPYVNKSGDTMTGGLTVSDTLTLQDASAVEALNNAIGESDLGATLVSTSLSLDNNKLSLTLTEKSYTKGVDGGIATEMGTQDAGTITTKTYTPITFDKSGAYVSTPTADTGIANKAYVDSKDGTFTGNCLVIEDATAVKALKEKDDGTTGVVGGELFADSSGEFGIAKRTGTVTTHYVFNEDSSYETVKGLTYSTSSFLTCKSDSVTLTGLGTPTNDGDAANKKYVDGLASTNKPGLAVLSLKDGAWKTYTSNAFLNSFYGATGLVYYQDVVPEYGKIPENAKCDIQLDFDSYQLLFEMGVYGLYAQNIGKQGESQSATVRVFTIYAEPSSTFKLQVTYTPIGSMAADLEEEYNCPLVGNFVTIGNGRLIV